MVLVLGERQRISPARDRGGRDTAITTRSVAVSLNLPKIYIRQSLTSRSSSSRDNWNPNFSVSLDIVHITMHGQSHAGILMNSRGEDNTPYDAGSHTSQVSRSRIQSFMVNGLGFTGLLALPKVPRTTEVQEQRQQVRPHIVWQLLEVNTGHLEVSIKHLGVAM